MQIVVGIDTPIAQVIQALAVLFVIGIGFAERRRLITQEKAAQPVLEQAPQE